MVSGGLWRVQPTRTGGNPELVLAAPLMLLAAPYSTATAQMELDQGRLREGYVASMLRA